MTAKSILTGVVGFGILFVLFVVFSTGCGPDWIVPTEPAFPLPPGCWQIEDPVTVTNGTSEVQVTAIQCPADQPPPSDPTTPPTDPTDPGTDAGTPENPPDAGNPNDGGSDPEYVRYNPRNGKCYKLNQHQFESHGQHRGWTIVTTEEVDCPSIQGTH